MIFESGLHVDFTMLKKVGGMATIVAIGGTFLPLLTGMVLIMLYDADQYTLWPVGLACGVTLAPTSVGMALKMLGERKQLGEEYGQLIVTAAFVDEIKPDGAGLQLVNLSPHATGDVVLQAGAFGEHEFTDVTWQGEGDSTQSKTISGRYFTVRLPPSTAIRLNLGLKRFTNRPSYAHPWHDGEVPVAIEREPAEQ